MKSTNTPPAMTKRPQAGQIARVIGWGVLTVFIALTADAYAMEFAVQNRTIGLLMAIGVLTVVRFSFA